MKTDRAMTDEFILKVSDLSQSLTREGKTVQVEIYGDGGNGWLLKVVDEYGNLTGWTCSFGSEQAALDEVLKTIDEEGMDCLIGPPAAGWY
jgi:hypothetical protein